LGASARAALIARGYAEMARFVTAMGGSAHTLTGLAGLGDLTLTCTSPQSRNYQFGMALGAGRTTDEILASGAKLAEGVATAPVAAALAQSLGVDAPLVDAVDAVVAGKADISTVVAGLMSRPLKREH
jgi:glycerol-3-phosphate dehydrogenase (NAD(P)+)